MVLKLLKSKIKGLDLFVDGTFEVDFIATKQVASYEVEDKIVSNLIGRNYVLNTMAFIGKNATGKTITINVLSDILSVFVGNKSLDHDMNLGAYFSKQCELENYFYYEKQVFKLVSTIEKNVEDGSLFFSKENLYKKTVTKSIPKKEFLVFELDEQPYFERNQLKKEQPFLKSEDSILSGIITQLDIDTTHAVKDMLEQTNFNVLSSFMKELPKSFASFLDPSIEKIDVIPPQAGEAKNNIKFKITFKNYSPIISEYGELDQYLSSGTIKGISILTNVFFILDSGGYLIIDEIENHFNKSIVLKIIQFFMSNLNKNGATLLFTTHYSEIIDSIERTDSIYINRKNSHISLQKFSDAADKLDRIDKKKSNLILSGVLNTAPSYDDYLSVYETLNEMMAKYE